MNTVQWLRLYIIFGLFPLPLFCHAIERSRVGFRVSDPASYVQGVSTAQGDFTAAEIDLSIAGPDPLVLTRFYNSGEEGPNFGEGWQIFPQTVLILGQDGDRQPFSIAGDSSGGFFVYRGKSGEPLKIDPLRDGIGMGNTYAKEINGQTNRLNNRLYWKGDTCELVLGDGTRRLYRETKEPSCDFLGRKIAAIPRSNIINPQYYQLLSEKLPSGNICLFSYENGRLSRVETKDSNQTKLHASICFTYDFQDNQCVITAKTHDDRILEYSFQHIKLENRSVSLLKSVKGSHCLPMSYEYEIRKGHCYLKRKNLPEERFFELEYDDLGRVKLLKEPSTASDESEITCRFSYENGFTDVHNANEIKTRYLYSARGYLAAIQYYDEKNDLYRIDRKYWGESELDCGLLKAMTVADGKGLVQSLRTFQYDHQGNIEQEWIYGNLTGQSPVSLIVGEKGELLNKTNVEGHLKKFKYSNDSFNLLKEMGDCKGVQVQFRHKKGTNWLISKIVKSNEDEILRRTFYSYNQDGVCSQIVEDDGSDEDPKQLQGVTERHITVIQPKENAPGVGLPMVMEEKVFDTKKMREILVRKLVHSYFPQGQISHTDVYDDIGTHIYTTNKTYTILGQLATETDPMGRKTFYEYDGIGNLVLMTVPHQNRTVVKKYDLRNRVFQIIEKSGDLQAIERYCYDSLGRKISSEDRFGQLTQFTYDAFGRLIKMICPTVFNEQEQSIQPEFSYTHDIFGNVVSTTDPSGYTTSKTYNIRGNVTQVLYPDGTSELFKYDAEGSLHRSLTRDNKVTVHEYDYLGRISYLETSKIVSEGEMIFLKGHSYEYNGFRVVKERELEGVNEFERITTFRHDAAGRITTSVQYDGNLSENDASSRKIAFTHDSLGREVKKKKWFGSGANDYSFECCEYDLLGQVKEKRAENAAGDVLLQRYFEYDPFGHCIEEYTFHNGHKEILAKTEYDPFGELIAYSDGLGNETVVTIDYSGSIFRKTLINPLGNHTEMTFDALGRMTSTITKDIRGDLLSSQMILYDASGNKTIEKIGNIWQGQLTSTQKTHWIYGPMGRLEAQVEEEGTSEERKTQFSYDKFGRLSSKTLPGSSPIAYRYNKRGFISQIEHKVDEKDRCILNQYSYDGAGNIISAKSLNGITIERDYDVFGQIIKETTGYDNADLGFSSLNYRYDRLGRLVKIVLPDQSNVTYVHDGLFGHSVQRLSSQGKLLYQHTYDSYDDQGRLSAETGIAGYRTVSHDRHGRKTCQQTDYFSESVPEKGYDPLGSLLSVERHGIFHLQNGAYVYDALSQLVSEQMESSKTYSNDSLGNCRLTDEEEIYYNDLNQLTNVSKREYFYDPQGNLLRKVSNKTEVRFTTDIFSNLLTVEKGDGTSLSCVSDPFGRRMVKSLFYSKGTKKTRLSFSQAFYCGYHELGTLNENGNIQELRVPGVSAQGISQTSIAIEIGKKTYAPLHDISGNVIALIDHATKLVAESYIYSAFAEEKIYDSDGNRIFRSAVGNPWRYKEKRMDEETGLIYFGFRYYDPDIRRWISPDPLGSLDGPNLYAFLHNNPLTSIDQFGLADESDTTNSLYNYFYGEVEKHCYCEHHRDCKRGGDIGDGALSSLPTIQYDFVFDKIWDTLNYTPTQSQIFDLQREEIANFGIGFINGIWNNREGAREGAEYISSLAGGYNVHYVHNASHGILVDFLECYMGLCCIATEPVRQLHNMWDDFFDKNSADAMFLMIGHSHGVLHMRNALLSYSQERRSRIMAIGIAPAAYIYEGTAASIEHYRVKSTWGDAVPRIDRAGSRRSQASVIDLPSDSYIPFMNHPLQSKVYKKPLKQVINAYLDQ